MGRCAVFSRRLSERCPLRRRFRSIIRRSVVAWIASYGVDLKRSWVEGQARDSHCAVVPFATEACLRIPTETKKPNSPLAQGRPTSERTNDNLSEPPTVESTTAAEGMARAGHCGRAGGWLAGRVESAPDVGARPRADRTDRTSP